MDSTDNINAASEMELNEEETEAAAEQAEQEMNEEDAKTTENEDRDTPSASKPSIDGASPGKIFVGGLPKDTTEETFKNHFEKYGKVVDSVIMKHRGTGHPRGFGFITYEDPTVVDVVILDTHVFDTKQVEIKRTIPKGAISGKDFKTKKIFVGGIPTSVDEDELKNFFAKFGEVEEHQIMRDHTSGRSRGFGFVAFSTEKAVDDLLTKGNRIEFGGAQVEIKKAEPKKPGNAPAGPPTKKLYSNTKPGAGRGFKGHQGGATGGAPVSGAYRYGASFGSGGGFGSRPRGYGGYFGSSEFDSSYGGYGGTGISSYRSDSSLGFSSRYGGLGRGYGLGRHDGPSETFGSYGGGAAGFGAGGYGSGGYGRGYDSGSGVGGGYGGIGGGYGGSDAGGLYGGRRDYGGGPTSRYHPYG